MRIRIHSHTLLFKYIGKLTRLSLYNSITKQYNFTIFYFNACNMLISTLAQILPATLVCHPLELWQLINVCNKFALQHILTTIHTRWQHAKRAPWMVTGLCNSCCRSIHPNVCRFGFTELHRTGLTWHNENAASGTTCKEFMFCG